MAAYLLEIHIEQPSLLRWYAGSVNAVVATAASGERVRMPLECLRPFVSDSGVHGRFRVQVDSNKRLQRIDRVG